MPTTAELATQLEALSASLSQSEQTNLNLQKTNDVLINRIQLLEQRVDPQPNLADLISTIKEQQLIQEALLKEALHSNNLLSSHLLTPLDSTTSSPKPPPHLTRILMFFIHLFSLVQQSNLTTSKKLSKFSNN